MRHTVICDSCGTTFHAHRSDAETCSGACRERRRRERAAQRAAQTAAELAHTAERLRRLADALTPAA